MENIFKVMIGIHSDDCLVVRWDKRIKRSNSVSIELERDLEQLDGVEDVVMENYSAYIRWADFATSSKKLAEDIKKVFEKHSDQINRIIFNGYKSFDPNLIIDVAIIV